MKKRWLILVLLAIAVVLCACGGEENVTETVHTDVQEGSTQIELFANESCALTLESVGTDAWGNYGWTVSMMNKTGKELIFTVDQVYVNDCEADPFWAEYAPAGQTTTSAISWFSSTFDDCGIRSVDRVDFTLSVYPSGDGTNLLAQDKITVYPNGEAAYHPSVYEAGEKDTVLVDAPELSFIATGSDPDGEWGYNLNVYMENRSDREQDYTVKNVKINGQLCDPYWYRTLDAGKKSFTYINWYTDELEHMEIFEVSRIEFDLVVTDAGSGTAVLEQHCVVEP